MQELYVFTMDSIGISMILIVLFGILMVFILASYLSFIFVRKRFDDIIDAEKRSTERATKLLILRLCYYRLGYREVMRILATTEEPQP